jgi:hypothetical protein
MRPPLFFSKWAVLWMLGVKVVGEGHFALKHRWKKQL